MVAIREEFVEGCLLDYRLAESRAAGGAHLRLWGRSSLCLWGHRSPAQCTMPYSEPGRGWSRAGLSWPAAHRPALDCSRPLPT